MNDNMVVYLKDSVTIIEAKPEDGGTRFTVHTEKGIWPFSGARHETFWLPLKAMTDEEILAD